MEEQILIDMQLNHYCSKLRELSDDVETLSRDLQITRSHAEENWRGLSGEACERHLSSCLDAICRLRTEISDLIILIENMGRREG